MSEKSEKDQNIFQSYLDNIQAKTGKTPADFRLPTAEKGLVKTAEIVNWLKSDFGLGHGHANALALVILSHGQESVSTEDAVATHFKRKKAGWRKPYDELMANVQQCGDDVGVGPAKSSISLLRGDQKFGIVQVSTERLDLGIKLKGVAPTDRLEVAGQWNAMVTHRVRISDPNQIDAEVLAWLKQAYAAA